MVAQIVDTLNSRFDRNTLTLQLPDALEHLKGKEKGAMMEMVLSNTL